MAHNKDISANRVKILIGNLIKNAPYSKFERDEAVEEESDFA